MSSPTDGVSSPTDGVSSPTDGVSSPTDGLSSLKDVLAVAQRSEPPGAPGCLAPNLRAWLASPEQGLAGAIESFWGPDATAEALARLAPSSLTLLATVHSDRACWAEIARHRSAESETCIAGLSHGRGGQVSRLVLLRAPLVPAAQPSAAPDDPDLATGAADARPVLESYFAALMGSRFREAAAHFTVDTIYSHPPYADGIERVMFRGRDALARGFETERGPSPARQIITDLWQRGRRVFVEGVVEGIPDGGTFFSTAELSPEGEIARYVAFYSGTRIPRPT